MRKASQRKTRFHFRILRSGNSILKIKSLRTLSQSIKLNSILQICNDRPASLVRMIKTREWARESSSGFCSTAQFHLRSAFLRNHPSRISKFPTKVKFLVSNESLGSLRAFAFYFSRFFLGSPCVCVSSYKLANYSDIQKRLFLKYVLGMYSLSANC